MTYLSRIRINPLRAEGRKIVSSPRVARAVVLGAVPADQMGGRVLWRLDADNPRRPFLLALTPSRPDWSHAVETAGWPQADGDHAVVRAYAPLLERLTVGREFAFRTTVNPVQNTCNPVTWSTVQTAKRQAQPDRTRERSFRIGHRTAGAQVGWFIKRTDGWGFDVPLSGAADVVLEEGAQPEADDLPRDLRVLARSRESFRKEGAGRPVVLTTATIEGRMVVTDTELLERALLSGIGPAKAYGCGLLTLAPLPTVRG
ncbi:type I-E CRISPR-associated protein Cas6/Cse3/CasE [Embleya sp. AB8]|uniref:type I-E CRISPR-associated protein Cas6/Cse3/CasE n=1 Tax=Embleya sp. AB8 TaxID=3156304 RepID=UPI003C7343F2